MVLGESSCQFGEAKTPLPRLIYVRVPEAFTQKLRISGFDRKALIREIEVLFEEYGCLDGRRRVGDYFPGAIQFQSGIWGGRYQTLVDVACSNDFANGIRRSRLPLRTWQSPLPTVEIPLTNRCKQLVRRQHGGHGGYVENYGDGKLLHTGEHIHSTLHLSPLKAN